MSGMVGAASVIKSVQIGAVSLAAGVLSGTATISAVVTGKASIDGLGGVSYGALIDGSKSGDIFATLALTNSTTVTIGRVTGNGAETVTFYFQVVEYI